jgi:branched-chain amino acid transport system substrate-binding protein
MGAKRTVAAALVALTASAALVGAACGSSKTLAAKSPATQQAEDANTIVIGAAVGLSGGLSAYDRGFVAALKMGVADLNKKGGVLGKQLKVVTADTQSDRARGPRAALSVINKGAKMVVTSCDFDFGSPAAIVAQQHKIPAFACAGSPKYGVQDIGPYAYTFSTGSNTEGSVAAEWTYKRLKARTAYVLIDDTISDDKDMCGAFKQRFKQLKGKIVGEDVFKNGDPSITSQITRIRNVSPKPAFIMLCTYLPGGATAVRQLRNAGINIPIVSGDGMDDNTWARGVPGLKNFFTVGYASIYGDDGRPAVNAFFKKFKKSNPLHNPFPLYGYAFAQAFAIAAKKAGTTDGNALRKALDSFRNVPLITGPTTFTPKQHYVPRPMAVVEIRNGTGHFRELFKAKKIMPPKF